MTKHLNACTKKVPRTAQLHKLHDDPVNTLVEDGSQLLDETNYTVRDAIDLPTKRIPWEGMFVSKSLSLLKKEWFTRNKFPAGIPVLDIKYKHPGLKH